jgi:hypothetical protein
MSVMGQYKVLHERLKYKQSIAACEKGTRGGETYVGGSGKKTSAGRDVG